MKLEYTYKYAFGNDRFYPACEASRAILECTKANSFMKWQLEKLKEAGFEIEVKSDVKI